MSSSLIQGMKRCSKCKVKKPHAEFTRATGRNGDNLHSQCKSCKNAWYIANKARHTENCTTGQLKRLAELRTVVWEALAAGCADCGIKDPLVLEFDHVLGTKAANISTLVQNKVSARRLKQELEKCAVRCANCHRRRTSMAQNHWKYVWSQAPA